MLGDKKAIDEKEEKSLSLFSEDPTRRLYKKILTAVFLVSNTLSLMVDILSLSIV